MSLQVVAVENLGKQYIIHGQQQTFTTLRESIMNSIQYFRPSSHRQWQEKFWALRGVSFKVERGEILGIIGRNGAGKSTLLKILSRITTPTEGQVTIHGRVGSLLEVGTGFHRELTGRENVFLSGSILGLRKKEIDEKFEDILKFAEIERFIDTQAKYYSSGMYVRLAFAVAAHLEPEILIIDEVLAVGDLSFQKKCLGKMNDVAKGGRTVLFVSHNMAAVRQLCTNGLVLDAGTVNYSGDVDNAIDFYLKNSSQPFQASDLRYRKDRSGSGSVCVNSFRARDSQYLGNEIRSMSDMDFIIGYNSKNSQSITRLYVGLIITNDLGVPIFSVSTAVSGSDFYNLPPQGYVICHIPKIPLIPGRYQVGIKLMDIHGLCDYITEAGSFDIIGCGDGEIASYFSSSSWGSVIMPHSWSLENKIDT